MSFISVDIEADGPCPGLYNMVCFGAVVVRPGLTDTFYAKTSPAFPDQWDPNALAVSGFSHEEHLNFPKPMVAMQDFANWIEKVSKGRPILISDNNGFDWQFINWYFYKFLGRNPFGWSSRNLGDLYKGVVRNMRKNFKHLRKTKHDHNPVNDAKGNAEAFMHMVENMRLKTNLD